MVTLRWAITAADTAGGDQTIDFDPSLTANGPETITLNGNALELNDQNGTLTINGPTGSDGNELTIDANTNVASGPSAVTVMPAPQMTINMGGYGVTFLKLVP